jgi:hypothetical protein
MPKEVEANVSESIACTAECQAAKDASPVASTSTTPVSTRAAPGASAPRASVTRTCPAARSVAGSARQAVATKRNPPISASDGTASPSGSRPNASAARSMMRPITCASTRTAIATIERQAPASPAP